VALAEPSPATALSECFRLSRSESTRGSRLLARLLECGLALVEPGVVLLSRVRSRTESFHKHSLG